MNDRRTELRLVLDVTGPAGDELIVMPIHLGKGGVTEGVEAMLKEAARQFPVRMQTPEGVLERLSSDISPLVSLVLYLCSQAAEIKETGAGKRVPTRPKPQKTKKGMRIFAPDHPSRWEVGYRLGAALGRRCRSMNQRNRPAPMPALVLISAGLTGTRSGSARRISPMPGP